MDWQFISNANALRWAYVLGDSLKTFIKYAGKTAKVVPGLSEGDKFAIANPWRI